MPSVFDRWRTHWATGELATAGRFLLVGMGNTLVGYGLILVALYLGAGDYLANACAYALGIPIAYYTQRRFTFAPLHKASLSEGWRYGVSVAVAYLANLVVLATGRSMGLEQNPWVQLAAICTYAAILFLLSRLIVFRAK